MLAKVTESGAKLFKDLEEGGGVGNLLITAARRGSL